MSDPEDIRALIQTSVEEIPALPLVVPRILSVLEADDSSATEIADVISRDPSLTARILKVANSVYYGLSGSVSTLQKAIVLIGLRTVKSLALTIPLVSAIPVRRAPGTFSRTELWTHSLAVATTMQRLAHGSGNRRGESLFLVGVIHDIGKIVLAEAFPKEYVEVLESVRSRDFPFLADAERARFGIDHGEVAALLLAHWRFPLFISLMIAAHHAVEVPEEVGRRELALLRVGNALAQELAIGSAGNVSAPEIAEEDLAILELSEEKLGEVADYVDQRRQGIADFYSCLT